MLIQECKGCEDQNQASQGDYHRSKNAKEGIGENGLHIRVIKEPTSRRSTRNE